MKKTKRMMCMGVVLSMMLSLNMSACAANVNNDDASAPAAESTASPQSGTDWWGESSGYGSETESLLDWWNSYFGSTEEEESAGNTAEESYPAPTNIIVSSKMTATSRTMEFSWDKVEGADKYIVQLSTTEDFSDDVKESSTKNIQYKYSTKGLNGVYHYPAHRTYYFRVKAVFGSHESAWSKTVVSRGDAD